MQDQVTALVTVLLITGLAVLSMGLDFASYFKNVEMNGSDRAKRIVFARKLKYKIIWNLVLYLIISLYVLWSSGVSLI